MKTLKKIYTKEYWLLICIGFLPLMWKVLEIAFLASFNNALKILGQIALIGIIFKIFEESILNPLFKILSKQNFKSEEDKIAIVNKFFISYLTSTIIFTIILITFSENILHISRVPEQIFYETLKFLKIYIIACGIGVIAKFLYTNSLINKDRKNMVIYLLLRSLLTTILFVCLVPKFSFGFGVNGIAISELVVNLLTILFLCGNCFKVKKTETKINLKEYFKLFSFSLCETLIRNIVYYFVILVLLNKLNNQDLYFVANDFIWSIMLVPTLAQSSLIKQDIANNKQASLKPYFTNAVILILFMILLIPIAFLIFKYVYNLPNFMDYFIVLLKLFPCYIIFVIDSIIEAYFISSGKLHHILVQTFITNILVYLTAFILYLSGILALSLNTIIILFNLGVIISSIYTISVYLLEKIKIKYASPSL